MATIAPAEHLASARQLAIGPCSIQPSPFDLPSLFKLKVPVSRAHEFSSMRMVASAASKNGMRFPYNVSDRTGRLIPGEVDLISGNFSGGQDCSGYKGKVYSSSYDQDYVDDQPVERVSRPPNLEARMRMKAYRRQALSERRNLDMEEEARNIDLDPAKMLKKGDPNTVQAVIRDVMPVGYFLTMPSGREGYLPATDLGTTGGVVLLERLMKVGQELTVRITKSIKTRDIVTIRPEGWVSPVENPFLRPRKTEN